MGKIKSIIGFARDNNRGYEEFNSDIAENYADAVDGSTLIAMPYFAFDIKNYKDVDMAIAGVRADTVIPVQPRL